VKSAVDIRDSEASAAETGVPLNDKPPLQAANAALGELLGLEPNEKDKPIEEAEKLLFYTVLDEPSVRGHVVALAEMRDAKQGYFAALQASPLIKVFGHSHLDYLVSRSRQRIRLGYWGQLGPVNGQGYGYGRQKDRKSKGMTPKVIADAVAAIVRQLPELDPEHTPEAEEDAQWVWCPKCEALVGDQCAGGTMHAERLKHAAKLEASEDAGTDIDDDEQDKKKRYSRQRKYLQRVGELVRS